MKSIICSLISLFITGTVVAQVQYAPPDDSSLVFVKVERDAQFQGGDKAWRKFVKKNLITSIPIKNNAPEGVYTVIVRFIVRKDGSVKDVRAETNFGYGMETEALRVINLIPNWIPPYQNGRPVNAYKRVPINFVIR